MPSTGALTRGSMLRSLHSSSTRRLFGLLHLRRPEQWQESSQEAIARCEDLVSELLAQQPSADTIRGLDEISDTICQSYDTAELCRNVHSCQHWQAAAQQACMTLGGYVHKLNTNKQLYGHLVQSLDKHSSRLSSNPAAQTHEGSTVDGYTPEALRVGRTLKDDFEKAGIHLPEEQRSRLTALVDLERRIGMQIGQNLTTPSKLGYLDMDVSGKRKADQQSSKLSLGQGNGSRRVTLHPGTLHSMLQNEPSAEQRERAYTAGYNTPKDNLHLLEDLVGTRYEMAQLMDAPSYAHYKLNSATLAGSPEAVESFLQELLAAIQPKVEDEMRLLRNYKAKHLGRSADDVHLDAWDRLFYMRIAQKEECPLDYAAAAAHFHVQGCIQCFKELLKAIMGIQVVELPLEPGEAWADKVQKLALEHEDEGRLGIIYLDLYPRPRKMGGASHFTLQCGRRLRDGSYQQPIVALACSFGLSSSGLMSPDQAKTLFHEFGHALHSLLSRTEFQHLAGTRGPMDLMEVPSHVVERFANSPAVLKSCMRHYISGRPMGPAMVGDLQRSQSLFEGINLHQQVVDALIDQRLHGVRGGTPGSTSSIVHDVLQQHSPFTSAQGTNPHARFHHFVGYGAVYFSYPYAVALSSAIWQQHFPDGRMHRASGDHIRQKMLQVGSSSEPVAYVEGILGKGHLCPVGSGHKPQINSLLKELKIA